MIADEDADLRWREAVLQRRTNPFSDGGGFRRGIVVAHDRRLRPVERGDGARAPLFQPIYVAQHLRQQPVRCGADLVRGPVVDFQRLRSPAHIHAERQP